MKTWHDRLQEALKARGKIPAELARYTGVKPPSVTGWLNGSTRNLVGPNAYKTCEFLKINPDWLFHGTMPSGLEEKDESAAVQPADNKKYPRVVGTAKMGDQGYYLDLDGGDGYVEFEAEEGAIAIRVRGDSMFPAIKDGWFVIIEPSGRPAIDEYVLLKFKDGKKMVKSLLQIKADCYVVESVNGGKRITAMIEELEDIRAISAVVPPSKHKT
jgi:phage repressor protein C with HTH and peptisase S24 domain